MYEYVYIHIKARKQCIAFTSIILVFRLGNILLLNRKGGNSLVAQWLRIRLPIQGTRVQALVWEDPTCCRATKPVCYNY